jgi:sigma-B regulation protein RsbU (phosphoserine phosphatase)
LLNGLAVISLQISQGIETQQKQQTILRHLQELDIARRIQQRTFPNVMPELAGFDIAGASRPAIETGGDYFDFVPQPEHELLFALGDVSGHGLGPALVAAGAHASVRILNMMDTGIETTIQLLNERLYEDTDLEFMTLFLGVLNPSNRTLSYYNAGHCPGIILDPHGAVRTRLPSENLPLGLISDHERRHGEVAQLVSGDLLLIHTDGIFEAFCPKGEMFGMIRVLESIRAARHLPAAAIISTLFRAVRKFSQTTPSDDMTAIVIKVT